MESFCACADPQIEKGAFYGLQQSFCRSCGNVTDGINIIESKDGGVNVKEESCEKVTVHLSRFLELLNRFCHVRRFPENIRQNVISLGQQLWKRCCFKDKEVYAVAIISEVLEKNGMEHSFKQLCETYKVSFLGARKAYKKVTGKQRFSPAFSAMEDIRNLASKCDELIVEKQRKLSQVEKITEMATKIYKLIEHELCYRSFKFTYLTSAICVLASKHFAPRGITNQDIADIQSLNMRHLSKMVALISRSLSDLADSIPWKPKHINARNIYLFLGDITEYCSPAPIENETVNENFCEETASLRKKIKIENALNRVQVMKNAKSHGKRERRNHRNSKDQSEPKRKMPLHFLSKKQFKARGHVKKKGKGESDTYNDTYHQSKADLHDRTVNSNVEAEWIDGQQSVAINVNPSACDHTTTSQTLLCQKKQPTLDAEDLLFEELLRKGCSVDELMQKNYHEASKSYFQDNDTGTEVLDEDDSDDISDTEIDYYCLTPKEVEVKALKMQQHFYVGL